MVHMLALVFGHDVEDLFSYTHAPEFYEYTILGLSLLQRENPLRSTISGLIPILMKIISERRIFEPPLRVLRPITPDR